MDSGGDASIVEVSGCLSTFRSIGAKDMRGVGLLQEVVAILT